MQFQNNNPNPIALVFKETDQNLSMISLMKYIGNWCRFSIS